MRVVVAVLTAVFVLTGCTQIPRSGPVESVNPSSVLSDTDVDFLPPGPSLGASPEDILEGFIAAGTAAQNNYRVARSYLTEQFHDTWNPNQSVLISQGEVECHSKLRVRACLPRAGGRECRRGRPLRSGGTTH